MYKRLASRQKDLGYRQDVIWKSNKDCAYFFSLCGFVLCGNKILVSKN